MSLLSLRPLLQTKALTVEIGGKTVCRQLDMTISIGQHWGLLGINGIGKTTLLHTLAGLRTPAQGEIRLDDELLGTLPRRTIAQKIGVLLQADNDAFPGTVMETVLSGRHPWLGQWQWEGENDRMLALAALSDVGLEGFEQRQVNTLSGGERRRLALATLLTQNPCLFLLDEPTNHLDLHHQAELLRLLGRLAEEGIGVISVFHDPNHALAAGQALLLDRGRVAAVGGAVEVVTGAAFARVYAGDVRVFVTPEGVAVLPRWP
ncbi:MAG: ABC transporter ATP-binding protein [Gammaproteobacteria bacterium]|nr:ABC transporter ATP-binding protein [Gammaproteobacteria bacterium]